MNDLISNQIKEHIERAGTLKPITGGGLMSMLFGAKAKDKIYFEASQRGVSRLILIGEEYPSAGVCYKTFLFSAEGEPQRVEEAVEIANTLNKQQLEYLSIQHAHTLVPTCAHNATDEAYKEKVKAVYALFGREFPEAVFAICDFFFDEKEAAGFVYNYVLWAINNGVLYVMPLKEKIVRKITK